MQLFELHDVRKNGGTQCSVHIILKRLVLRTTQKLRGSGTDAWHLTVGFPSSRRIPAHSGACQWEEREYTGVHRRITHAFIKKSYGVACVAKQQFICNTSLDNEVVLHVNHCPCGALECLPHIARGQRRCKGSLVFYDLWNLTRIVQWEKTIWKKLLLETDNKMHMNM